jgi:RNA polymerase sigma factor (sigma-70 family)
MMSTDAELLRRYAAEKSEAAFAELVQRHIALVYSTALRQLGGDAHLAQDVTQTVFTTLARKAATLLDRDALAGWLYLGAHHVAAQAARTERRRRAREQEAHLMHEVTAPSSAATDWERVRPALDEALRELREMDREAVLLRFFEQRPFAEIGAALRLSEDAARMRVERALDTLHALLARRGITSTSAALGVMLASEASAAAVPAGLAGSVTSAALASAAVTSVVGPAAAVFGFMGTSKMVVAVAVVLAVGGVGSAWYERTEAQRAESAFVAAQRERDAVQAQLARNQAQLRTAEERARAIEARFAALEKQSGERAISTRGAQPPGALATSPVKPAVDPNPGMDPMLANPDYVRLHVQRYRADLTLKFGAFYKALKLSPEQIEKFESNRAEFQQATMEVWSSAMAKGVSIADPGINKLAGESVKMLDAELRSLLGDEGYKEYAQYSRSESARELVGTFAGYLYPTGSPLAAEQGERLVQLVADNTRRVPAGPNSKVIRQEVDWSAVAVQAASFLTPAQAGAFQALTERKKVDEEMSRLRTRTNTASALPKAGG